MNNIIGTGRIGTGLCRNVFKNQYIGFNQKSLIIKYANYSTQSNNNTNSTQSFRSTSATTPFQSTTKSSPQSPLSTKQGTQPNWLKLETAGIPNIDIVKYGVPAFILITTIIIALRRETPVQTAVSIPIVENASSATVNLTNKESFVQIGKYSFNQRDVEEAFIAAPDQFINDVIHLSSNLEQIDETDKESKYRSLCLFARNILLTDSACSSDVLKIAKIHFEKAIKAEKETVIYKLISVTNSIETSIINVVKYFGNYIGGHISTLSLLVKDQFTFLWNKVNTLI